MAATEGKPDEALAAARDALAAGLHLKLRSFVPALKAHCAAGNVDAAFEVRCCSHLRCIAEFSGVRSCLLKTQRQQHNPARPIGLTRARSSAHTGA